MHVPPPSQVRPPFCAQLVPCGRFVENGMPMKHMGVAQSLVMAGMSVSSLTSWALPLPSQTFFRQLPDICEVVVAPSGLKSSPQVPLQVRVWQSVSLPGHSLALMHSTQAPAPSHSLALALPATLQATPAPHGGLDAV